jgi:hypothetical protein
MARDIFAKPYDKDSLTLKRASASRPSGRWSDDDFDVLSNGTVVGRILKIHAAPVRKPLDVDVSHRASRRPPHRRTATSRRAKLRCRRSKLAGRMRGGCGLRSLSYCRPTLMSFPLAATQNPSLVA